VKTPHLLAAGFALLGAAATAAPELAPGFPDPPEAYGDAASLRRARALALPEDAASFKAAVRELSLESGYFSLFHDPTASTPPRVLDHPVTFDFSAGRFIDADTHKPLHNAVLFHDGRAISIDAEGHAKVVDPHAVGELLARTARLTIDPAAAELTPVVSEAGAGFPGEVIDEVIVPVPSEIFLVLDKLGKPDWKGQLRSGRHASPSNRIDVALLLGNVVAEGFVAVQAEDRSAVEQIGKDVLRLSESLGLKETVLPHTNSILEASKHSHWEIVRVELDKTQKTVRDTMEQHRDSELAQCVSLGGWLRGTEAVTDLINKNYTSDSAELLNQPDIIRHFQKELKKLAAKNQKLKEMLAGLDTIAQVIGNGDEPPNATGVQTIHSTTARLVKSISTPGK
jgi:hypothetical protein